MYDELFIIENNIYLNHNLVNIRNLSNERVYKIFYFDSFDLSKETAKFIMENYCTINLIKVEKALKIGIGIHNVFYKYYYFHVLKDKNVTKISLAINHDDSYIDILTILDKDIFGEIHYIIFINNLLRYKYFFILIFLITIVIICQIYTFPKINLLNKQNLLKLFD